MIYSESGSVEPIVIETVDVNADPLTGLADCYVRILRVADGYLYDWNDGTFKAAGWTTLNKVLTEIDATNAPGLYQVTGGLDTTGMSGSYLIIPIQTPGTNAVLPSPEELRVGEWVDQIYQNGTDIAAVDGKVVAAAAADVAASAVTDGKVDSAIDAISTVHKWQKNRQKLMDGSVNNMLTYDDDDVTVIGTQDVVDKSGNPILLPEGVPAERSRAT